MLQLKQQPTSLFVRYLRSPPKAAVIMEITPDLAVEMLLCNTSNRPLRLRKVDQLVGAIKRGEFRRNGDTIRFSASGRLLDGQHRLNAIANSKCTVTTDVVFGLADEAQDTMDLGARRTAGDQLGITGITNPNLCAATAALVWRYRQVPRMAQREPTISQIRDVIERDPVENVCALVHKEHRLKGHPSSFMAMVGVLTSRDSGQLLDFVQRVTTGLNIVSTHDPVYRLRLEVERNREASRRLARDDLAALTVKAWNSFCNGQEMRMLRFTKAEAFPPVI